MQKHPFKGTGVAIVTPFLENKEIDYNSLEKIINYVIDNGVDYLVALGTTSEAATLNKDEKIQVVEFIKKINNKRLPIVLGLGGNNTSQLINDIKNTDLNGIDAILSVSPYYNKPSQQGIYEHFKEVAKTSPLPVILYNVPGRTSSNISAETCLKLANEFENIIGIKEASGNFDQIMQIIKYKPKNFLVISGDDLLTLPTLTIGGSGVISVLANSHPKEFSKMVNLAFENNIEKAKEIHYSLSDYINLIFEDGNPSGIKAGLSIMGLCKNIFRLPVVKVNDSVYSRIKEFIIK